MVAAQAYLQTYHRHCYLCPLGVTKQRNAVTSNECRGNEKTSNGIKIQEEKKILMKEKLKNGCHILIMTFTNLEKYVYFKKCLKQRRA